MSVPRLVFASRLPPVGAPSGFRIRTEKLLEALAGRFEVTLVTHAADGEDVRGSGTGDVHVVTAPAPTRRPKRVEQAASLASRRSWSFGRALAPAFVSLLHDTVARVRPTLIHYNDLATALAGPIPGPVNVYGSHNVEHRIAAGAARTSTGPRKLFAAAEAPRIRREELRVWRTMDLTLAISEVDAAVMRAASASRVELCLVGTDPVPKAAIPPLGPGAPLRLLFVGALTYHPNEQGLEWFVTRVLPAIRAERPVVLDVVGDLASPPAPHPDVTYHGAVPSLDTYYERAHAAIVPIQYGSGSRGKVVEAMAYGRPLVSTTIGVEGVSIAPDTHYLRADDPPAFAQQLLRLAGRLEGEAPDPDLHPMLACARSVAERYFWPTVQEGLVELYGREVERTRATVGSRSA